MEKKTIPFRLTILIFAGFLFFSKPTTVYSQVEIESDPIAYILDGYSGHIAYVFDPMRVSVGVFGADQPEFFHGHEGWKVKSRGVTTKIDYLIPKLKGFFVGLDAVYSWNKYTLESASETKNQNNLGLGVRTGYRFTFKNTGFYVVPWVSISHQFNADDVVISGDRFEPDRISIFPTIHLGWQF